MLYRLPKTRKYNYRPQFYKEESDQDTSERRIKFRRNYLSQKKRRPYIGFLLLVFIVFFILYFLERYQVAAPEDMNIQGLEIVR
jgi:hypothetical protein